MTIISLALLGTFTALSKIPPSRILTALWSPRAKVSIAPARVRVAHSRTVPSQPAKLLTDVSNEHVFQCNGLAPHFTVKVESPRSQPSCLQNSLQRNKIHKLDLHHKSCAHTHTFIIKVAFLTSIGNWSVSQPRSGDPVLASIEPSIPNLNMKISHQWILMEAMKVSIMESAK